MEVKENMTLGTTLVTNPKGGFLVRKNFLPISREVCVFLRYHTKYFTLFHLLKACGPLYAYKCGRLHYTTGVCSNVSSTFETVKAIAPSVQGMHATGILLCV